MTVIGRNPPQELVAAARRDRRLVLTGFVDDVRPYLEEASVYVCPIRDGGGTRLKILDALAMRKPVVASSVAVEGLEVTSDKHLVIADTPRDFARQVTRLLKERDLRESLASEGRRLVEERYDWSAIGSKLNDVYEKTVERFRIEGHDGQSR
jgi:glycosyltransferase involved in cell wall biosynthesis